MFSPKLLRPRDGKRQLWAALSSFFPFELTTIYDSRISQYLVCNQSTMLSRGVVDFGSDFKVDKDCRFLGVRPFLFKQT